MYPRRRSFSVVKPVAPWLFVSIVVGSQNSLAVGFDVWYILAFKDGILGFYCPGFPKMLIPLRFEASSSCPSSCFKARELPEGSSRMGLSFTSAIPDLIFLAIILYFSRLGDILGAGCCKPLRPYCSAGFCPSFYSSVSDYSYSMSLLRRLWTGALSLKPASAPYAIWAAFKVLLSVNCFKSIFWLDGCCFRY